jgi:HAE1 family hydrophobic/amphiphilic exporter-1
MTLTEISIKRPTLIVVLFSVLGFLGLVGYSNLKYELLPDMSFPVLTVTTVYPGAGPTEVENSVTKEIEDQLVSLEGIRTVISNSSEGFSLIVVEMQQSVDVQEALQEAERLLNQVTGALPEEADEPILSNISLSEIPVLRMGITSDMDPKDFKKFVEDKIVPSISKVEGVGRIGLVGGLEREIEVRLNADRIAAKGLDITQLVQLTGLSNMEYPTGSLETSENKYTVRLAGKFNNIEELRNQTVGFGPSGESVRLGDVATVVDATADPENIARITVMEKGLRNTAVGMLVVKQSDANAVDMSRSVRERLVELEEIHADKNLDFEITQDGSEFTIEAANAVQFDLMLAVIMVALVMLLFLHSLRNSLIVMIAIPASLISTFLMMWLLDFSLNLMTLLAMSLVIGILVDDSIVVLENIYRYLEKGMPRRLAALKGRNEIGFAALSITMIDVVVFLPLAVVTGIIGNILREFSLVMATSTLLSLLVSFTITPALAARIGKVETINKSNPFGWIAHKFEQFQDWLTEQYGHILKWSLDHYKTIIVGAGALFIASLLLPANGFIGGEFITKADQGDFSMVLEGRPGMTIEESDAIAKRAEKIIMDMPYVSTIFTNVGASSDGLLTTSSENVSEVNISLVPATERPISTEIFMEDLREQLMVIPDIKVEMRPIGIFGSADETPIQVVLNGPNDDAVRQAADTLFRVMSKVPGTSDVRLSSQSGNPETKISVDRDKLSTFGLSIAQVGQVLRVALAGDDSSEITLGGEEYDINIKLDESDRNDITDLRYVPFVTPQGNTVYLGQFADIVQTVGPTKLSRFNRNRSITVTSQTSGRPVGDIVAQFRNEIAGYELPVGVELEYLGEEKNQQDSNSSLLIAMLAAIVFMYLVMVALYDSYSYPLIILFSLPLALIGAFLALALTLNTLNIFSIIGMIVLMGLVGKNAILLVDRANQMIREEGLEVKPALLEAASTRLRPILMTTISLIIGIMPIALATGAGSEWKHGLAWVLIGGLTSSMFLTLVVVPAVYIMFDKVGGFFGRFRKKDKDGKDLPPTNGNGSTHLDPKLYASLTDGEKAFLEEEKTV